MSSEFANAKVALPRSKKPLVFDASGTWDKTKWGEAVKELGPAARPGDQIQITRIAINDDNIVIEINGGLKSGRKWYDGVSVGMGNTGGPVARSGSVTLGTAIEVKFAKNIETLDTASLKKILAPLMQFDQRSATEQFVESLPPEVKTAIEQKRAIEGMDKEHVLLALGRPRTKTRETKDGVDLEDWIYGAPPGKITFVTFDGNKVVKIKDAYAGLGGTTAAPLPPK